MRVLSFVVDKQVIMKDPQCDFSNIVPGSEGYLAVKFKFSPEWDNCAKVVGFYHGRTEFPPQVVDEDNACMIPSEALVNPWFSIQVFGKRKGYQIGTKKITIEQNGGRV